MTSATSAATPDLIIRRESPYNAETPLGPESEWLTPVESFYVRNHFAAPSHPSDLLQISGEVAKPLSLSIDDIKRLSRHSLIVTLECAGNGRAYLDPATPGVPWQIGAVGTAEWAGARLGEVLRQAQIRETARELVFAGADRGTVDGLLGEIRYERSLTVEEAMRDSVLLAYEMNGRALPAEHGGPLRLVVAGWYGMASVKWLERIAAVTEPFQGHFQTTDYVVRRAESVTPCRQMAVRSITTSPRDGAELEVRRSVTIRGFCWSGKASVAGVTVSTDAGQTWMRAAVQDPISPHAWQSWSMDWTPERAGRFAILSQASDEAGDTQPVDQVWTSSGYTNNAAVPVEVVVS
jgi:DMSO/TMAO reductase YedYZ molybdopterin-dependent catalytic subunit